MRIFLKHILMISALVLIFWFGCPIYNFLHTQCPCCGTTRAWLSLLRGDIVSAFRYHHLFFLVPGILFLAVHSNVGWFKTRLTKIYKLLPLFGVMLFAYQILRWCKVL